MTHLYVTSGSATGGPVPRTLELDFFQNSPTTYPVVLQYRNVHELELDRFNNTNTFYNLVLAHIVVSPLTLAATANVNTFYDIQLALIPYVPDNAETTALLAEATGVYSNSDKIHIDRMITSLKAAGVWSKLDWFYGGVFMANEHDSLLDWTQPTRSLVKVGTPTFTPFSGWQGMSSLNNSKLKSGWQPTDGPNSTATSFALFVHVDSANAENNAQAAGNWERSSGGGPSAPMGTFITLGIVTSTWDAGANVNPFDGVPGAALTGLPATFAVTRSGTAIAAVRNGASVGTDTAATHFERTHADGLCILGSATGLAAGRAFNGFISYAGWGAFLTPTELGAVDAAITAAFLPIEVVTDALLVDGLDNYLLVDGAGNYLKVR